MIFRSLCSGIEAASVAWHPLGWRADAFAENEKFASAVLAHHYPTTPNLGDMTKFEDWPDATFDVLVGGTPCQDFSIAGLRAGLDGERGQLTLVYAQIARRYRPRWMVWENVPGVLSNNDGRDFAEVLGLLSGKRLTIPKGGWQNSGVVEGIDRAYGLAWRVLDAQYIRVDGYARAVPQRRRRVFVVGYLGDWRRAAAVLFERDSMSGNPSPRRQAGKGFACDVVSSLVSSGRGVERPGETRGQDPVVAVAFGGNNQSGPIDVATAQTAHGGSGRFDFESETFVAQSAGTLSANGKAAGSATGQDAENGLLVAHALRGEGFDASEDGTGRGTPIVPVNSPTICFSAKDHGADAMSDLSPTLRAGGFDKSHANAGVMPAVMYRQEMPNAYASQTNAGALLRRVRDEIGAEAFAEWGLGILDTLQPAEILRSALHGRELRPAAFSRRWVVYCALSREEGRTQGAVQSMREAAGDRRAPQGWQPSQQLARELGAYLSELPQPGAQAERFMHDMWIASEGLGILREALSAVQKARRPSSHQDTAPQDVSLREGGAREGAVRPALHGSETAWRVRRLLVEECEFLQGFPRGYTAIPYRGKLAADGPRYKALGNSMAVNVMRWIGARIQMVDGITIKEAAE